MRPLTPRGSGAAVEGPPALQRRTGRPPGRQGRGAAPPGIARVRPASNFEMGDATEMIEIGWKKICCPVDLSDESRAALRVATDLCRRFGADLTLLHVEEGGAPGVDGSLARWKQEAAAAGVTRVATEETRGDPKTAIAEYANAGGFDLVVMGTHGRTGRTHALVGSVAENTVRQARCPVLVVHAEWPGLAR